MNEIRKLALEYHKYLKTLADRHNDTPGFLVKAGVAKSYDDYVASVLGKKKPRKKQCKPIVVEGSLKSRLKKQAIGELALLLKAHKAKLEQEEKRLAEELEEMLAEELDLGAWA